MAGRIGRRRRHWLTKSTPAPTANPPHTLKTKMLKGHARMWYRLKLRQWTSSTGFRCELPGRQTGRVEVHADHSKQSFQGAPAPGRSDHFMRSLVSPISAVVRTCRGVVAERGVEVDASCIWRWVQAYAPELNKRCRPHLKPTNKSYRIDETYIKVKGEDKYLYRALDSTGQTIDFLLTAKRDTAAAKRFLRKAMDASGNPMPRVINVDKNPAYPAAVEALKADGTIPRRVALR